MLKELRIKNFRIHENLNITFGPRVNCIIGDNAVGKSTILRAIRYAALNQPSGDSVRKWGSKKTTVRLDYKKHKILRIKSNSKNIYKLDDKKFTAFGRSGVPDEIKKILGLSEINFQGQHDTPFWFSNTAGEVSRKLNSIVNLEVIDKTLSTIAANIHKSNITVEIIEQRLKEVKEKKDSLKYVKEMHISLLSIESLEKAKIENIGKLAVIEQLLQSGRIYVIEADVCQKRLSVAVLVMRTYLKRRQNSKKLKSLSNLVQSAVSLQKIIDNVPPVIDHIIRLHEDRQKNEAEQMILEDIIYNIQYYKEKLCPLRKKIKTNERKLRKMEAKGCPLCGKT